MKTQLQDIVNEVTAQVRQGNFRVDYRNKAFVRIITEDGLQVDFHKYGDVCLTYRGEGTLEAYLLARKKAITDEMTKHGEAIETLKNEMIEVQEQLHEVYNNK